MRGRPSSFDSYPELKLRIDDEDWDIPPHAVLVLRNAGPKGGPGMPEWGMGMLPMPKALLNKGCQDMVRLSDARMSGTSYGACVLHIAPGRWPARASARDMVRLDVPNRRLDMLVSEDELAARKAAWTQPQPKFGRGYGWMLSQHILQVDKGCDFDFLETGFGDPVGEPDIY